MHSNWDMYNISEERLDALVSGNNQIGLAIFTLCLGLFAAFLVTLLTVELSDKKSAFFISVTLTSGILSIFFGLQAGREWAKGRAEIRRIKDQTKS